MFLLGKSPPESLPTFCRLMSSFFGTGENVKKSRRPHHGMRTTRRDRIRSLFRSSLPALGRRFPWYRADQETNTRPVRNGRRWYWRINRAWSLVRALPFRRIEHLLRYCFTDSQYDGRALQALYRRHYGDRRMFDMRTSWSGIKVAVIAMAELPVLLTNYHVHRPRPLNGGKLTEASRCLADGADPTCRIYPSPEIDPRPRTSNLAMVSIPIEDVGRGIV